MAENKTTKVEAFISHSSTDKDVAILVADLLHEAFNLQKQKIRCTSAPGYKLPPGCSIDETLRAETGATIFLGIITENSIQSSFVLFEMGARWGSKKPFFAGVAHGFSMAKLEPPLNGLQNVDFGCETDVSDLLTEIADQSGLKLEKLSSYHSVMKSLCDLAAKKQLQRPEETKNFSSSDIETELSLNEENALATLFRCDRSASIEEIAEHLKMGMTERQTTRLAFENLENSGLVESTKRIGGTYPAGGMNFYQISSNGIKRCVELGIDEDVAMDDIILGEEFPAAS